MSKFTPTTELALLLTAMWAAKGVKPLSNSEFAELKLALGHGQEGAANLLNGASGLAELPFELPRLQGLLGRGLGVFESIDRWQRAGIWVVSWGDADYPEQFKPLKHRAPVLIFGCGSPAALGPRALAIVGSRNASDDRLGMAAEIGRAWSDAGVTVVSGGARGVDSSAMSAGLAGTGTVVAVLASSLLKESSSERYRDAIRGGRVCLMSEVNPEVGFRVGNAMARNRLIYACGSATLVVECEPNKGGTWTGALEALKQPKRVYVLKGAKAERELVEKGAIPIDLSFALEPMRLISGERPAPEVPGAIQVAEWASKFLGNPLRQVEELTREWVDSRDDLIQALIAAAFADGLVERPPDAPPPRKKRKKAVKSIETTGTLFSDDGADGAAGS